MGITKITIIGGIGKDGQPEKLQRDVHGGVCVTDRVMWEQRALIKGQTWFVEDSGVPVLNITGAGCLDLGGTMAPQEYLDSVRQGDNFEVKDKENPNAPVRNGEEPVRDSDDFYLPGGGERSADSRVGVDA